jgi:hypothetical protein
MKIKLSKSQWEQMGRKAGWMNTDNIRVAVSMQSIAEMEARKILDDGMLNNFFRGDPGSCAFDDEEMWIAVTNAIIKKLQEGLAIVTANLQKDREEQRQREMKMDRPKSLSRDVGELI